MIRKILVTLLGVAIPVTFFWLLGSLVACDFNPSHWLGFGRFMIMLQLVWACPLSVGIATLIEERILMVTKEVKEWSLSDLEGGARACCWRGPQNGQPLCPCMMRNVRVVNGRYIKTEDLGPVK